MENKYYVPSIEEFHVGFEYELRTVLCHTTPPTVTDEYVKMSFYSTENSNIKIEDIVYFIKNEWVRVKCLCEQDILDCGWVKSGQYSSPYSGKKFPTFLIEKTEGFNTGTRYTISFTDFKQIRVSKDIFSHLGSSVEEMFLYIQNKSELKRLMKQLGING